MSPEPLPILHLDDDLVAVDKPAGLLVHPSALDAHADGSALEALQAQLGQRLWPLHRLDKGTSGVLLFVLNAEVAALLGQRFESGNGLKKTYHAMVRGWPAAHGLIDHPLKRMDDDDRPERTTLQDARTSFQALVRHTLPVAHGPYATTRAARLALQPLTGRRHQLRRHLKHIAHPILGDATHGKGPLNRALAAHLGLQRLWLHAWQLEVPHPETGAALRIDSGLRWPPVAAPLSTPTLPPSAQDWQRLLCLPGWERRGS